MQALRVLMRQLAPLTLLLALVAATGRLVAPAGLMPVAGPDGVHFVLCSGQAALAGDTGGHQPAGDGSCAFAMAAAHGDVPLPVVPGIAPQLPAIATDASALPMPNIGAGIGSRSQPSTGPPARA